MMNRHFTALLTSLAFCGCHISCEQPAPASAQDAGDPAPRAAAPPPADPNRARLEAVEMARAAQALDPDVLRRFAAFEREVLEVRRRIASDVPDPAERAAVLRRKVPRHELLAASVRAGIELNRTAGLRLLTEEYYAAREESWRAEKSLAPASERIVAARGRNVPLAREDEALEAAAISAGERFLPYRKDAEARWGPTAVALLEQFAGEFYEIRRADLQARERGGAGAGAPGRTQRAPVR